MLARHWRRGAAAVSLATALWTAWFTAGPVGEWFTTALFLVVPPIIAALIAPAWRSGAAVTGALLVAFAGLVLFSTERPDSLRPPQTDWLLPYLALALVAWIAAFAARVVAADPERRKTVLLAGAGGAVVLLCLAGIVAGGPGGQRPGSGDVDIDRNDLVPFPAALQDRRVDVDCRTGTGVCTELIEFWSETGQSPDEIAATVAAHLRTRGWPMAEDPRTGRLTGCLPIRGVLHWSDRACAELVASADLDWPEDVKHHDDGLVLALGAQPLSSSG
ncbi:hypothetical protein ABT369_44925 [Dactylosporangium sp. NPDC000244]|uniref:hypothetical protein n=1 Tax=Dactylosporangium sp. NPDC000244 TaxID=3154365 RepID=UPI0033333F77